MHGMGCGGTCGCGGACSCGGSCGCGSAEQKTQHPHTYCITCGQQHDGPDELFAHNEQEHRLPELNHCPVCGTDITAKVDGEEAERRTWLQTHLRESDDQHAQFLRLQPPGVPK